MANSPVRQKMADAIRVLAMDAVDAANSGHPGMPMGMADAATALFADHLKFDPSAPNWPDRDRFVLSAGHGSMLLYALLHLTGYEDMTLDELRNFRQLGAKTAGHPEYGHASGIETTTGPLGQGFANAVGMAMAERHLAGRFSDDIVNHNTYVIAGDGCLMEGISHEAASMAGHMQLGRLIVLFDDNGISIDGSVDITVSDDISARFEAYGWQVLSCDGHDMDAVSSAISWFFGLEEEGVILEDDCLPSQSFFSYCEEMLCRYRDEQRVMAITGTNITHNMHFAGNYFFSRYALMWGWASWASSWEAYDLELANWPKNNQIRHLKMLGMVKLTECIAWKQILTRTKAKLVDTWDYQWIYSCWLRGGLTIAPAKNLITNIGYSSEATHTTGYHPILSNLPLDDLCSPFEIPPEIKPHSRADAFIARHWFGANEKLVAKYILAAIPGVKKINQFRKTYFEKRN